MFAIQAAGRSATRQLRYDVNNLINNAASDMSVHWNKTNRAFTDRLVLRLRPCHTHTLLSPRISECQDAHRNLKSNLILTKNVSSFQPLLSSPPTSWTWVLAENKETCRQQQNLPQKISTRKFSVLHSWGRFCSFCSGHLHVLTWADITRAS